MSPAGIAGRFAAAALAASLELHASPLSLPQPDGGALELEAPATRIVSLAPNVTELLFAAGAGDRVVGVVAYSDYPEAALALPRIGDAFRFDIERIVSLAPDLVVAWSSGNPSVALGRLESLGLSVWRTEAREPADIATLLEAMGRAAGTEAVADPAAAALRARIQGLARSHGGAPPVRYFYQVAPRPLFTVTSGHLISRGLALCGGENVFDAALGLAPQVSVEAVLAADPDALLAPVGADEADPLAAWAAWPRMKAVRNGARFTLPADEISRATPRLLDALERACTLLAGVRGAAHEE